MKCLLFIITVFLGRCIYVQGVNDADSNLPDSDIIEANPPEELEQSNYDDKDDNGGKEYPSKAETEENGSEESEQSTYDKYNSNSDENPSESESSEQESLQKKKIHSLKSEKSNDENRYKDFTEETLKRYFSEMKAGDMADLIGQNQHIEQSHMYNDLGRRSVPQALKNVAVENVAAEKVAAENVDYLTPEKAPPELVLLVAKESALLRAGKDTDEGSDIDRKKILRSGNYWNGVWKEEVKPKTAMRSAPQKKKLGSIKARIRPGTELYKVVSEMKKISPLLLYIINKKQP